MTTVRDIVKVAFWVLKTSDHLLQLSPVLAALTLQGQSPALYFWDLQLFIPRQSRGGNGVS